MNLPSRSAARLLLMTLVLCAVALPVFAADATAASGDNPGLSLKAEMAAAFTGNLSSLYLCTDPSVVWRPRALGVGVGMELLIGFSQFDIYLNPYLRAEAGVFHLDLGYILTLAKPPDGSGIGGPTAGIAWAPHPFALAWGKLGFELGLDFNIPRFVEVYQDKAWAGPLEQVATGLIFSGRLGLGATYSFPLF